ncbi:MAG: hypothetical protein HUN05_01650 [Desulfobacter sp.]|nr:MAG: hypothetical protein HUN05_01650 [Desulfobacter sp.]
MKRLGFILTLVFTAARLFASPNLDDFSDIEGVRVYRDHAKSALFFSVPARLP